MCAFKNTSDGWAPYESDIKIRFRTINIVKRINSKGVVGDESVN
jgi:hypothetical protein